MRSTVFFFVLMAGWLLFGCGGASREGLEGTKADHVLIYPIPTNPTKLDPAAVEDGDTIEVLEQVFEGLIQFDEQNQVVPNLAERWEISEDHLTYTFYLKRGVKFHNGREMTAEDVKFSWERAANPAVLSPTVKGYMADIVGIEDVLAGKTLSLAGVRVLDDYTLQVRVKEPKPYWILYLRYPCYYVVAREACGFKPITDISQAIGTGPFKFQEYRRDQYVDLVRFDDYHGGRPKLERIRRLIVADPQTRFAMFESGEVDWIQLERQDQDLVERSPYLKRYLKRVDRPAIWYVGFDLGEYPPFQDARVRKAFAMAINKDRIIQQAFQGANQRADGIIPPGVPGYDPNFKGLPYDPAEARRLLAEAGYSKDKELPPLRLYFRIDRHDPKVVAQMVQQDLKANLGVDVTLQGMEWGSLLELRNKGKLPFFHLRWHADYLDPQNFLSFMLHSKARENTLDWANPEFDRLCDLADREFDLAKRLELYRKAERIAVVEDPIWIPIYFQRDLELIRPQVTGIRRMLLGPLPHIETDVVWAKG